MNLWSRLLPRDPNLWVFGSYAGRFADNSRWLFVHCNRLDRGPRTTWITKSRVVASELRRAGYEAYWKYTVGSVRSCLRAGVFVYDSTLNDISYPLSARALLANLWHGIPLKRIEADICSDSHWRKWGYTKGVKGLAYRLLAPGAIVQPDLMVATSPVVADRLAAAFKLPSHTLVVTGYPRNDVLKKRKQVPLLSVEATLSEQLQCRREEGITLLWYLPTFREQGSRSRIWTWLESPSLIRLLERIDGQILVKPHPSDTTACAVTPGRIEILDQGLDLYALLKAEDVLITDYSSVMFDFALIGGRCLLYPLDIDAYASERGLYFAYSKLAEIGRIARSEEELYAAIEDASPNGMWRHQAARDDTTFIREIHTYLDGQSSQRVVDAVRHLANSRSTRA